MTADRRELLGILGELVAANTVNPPGNESAAAAVVARFLAECGIPYQTYEKVPGRANIIGSIGSGSPVLLVASHLDTVPAGEGWSSDPFVLRVDGDRAYGRGANDNKSAMAGSLIAAKRLMQSGRTLGGTLLIAGVADEERGNEFGVKYLLEEAGLEADYAIAPDSSGHMEEIDVAEKGVLFVTIGCRGAAAHGSRPQEGVNAITAMAALLSLVDSDGVPSPAHPHFSPATVNVGKVRGGTAANVVPDYCEAEVDFRVLPGTTEGEVASFLKERMDRACISHPGAVFDFETRFSMPPHEVAFDSPLVRAAQAASERAFGRRMRPLYQGGVTIAKEFALRGIPAIGLGPGSAAAAHRADEWIEIDEVLSLADFIVEVAGELLGV